MNHTCSGDIFDRAGKTWGRCLRDGSLFVVTDTGMAACPKCERPWTGTPVEEGNNFWDPDDDEDVAMLIDLPLLDDEVKRWRAATGCDSPDDVHAQVAAELARLRELEAAFMECGIGGESRRLHAAIAAARRAQEEGR